MANWHFWILVLRCTPRFSKYTRRLIFEWCSSWTLFFSSSWKRLKTGFFNISLDCTSIFPQLTKQLRGWDFWSSLPFTFCNIVRIVFRAGYMRWLGEPKFIMQQFKNCKVFLRLHCCYHTKSTSSFWNKPHLFAHTSLCSDSSNMQ